MAVKKSRLIKILKSSHAVSYEHIYLIHARISIATYYKRTTAFCNLMRIIPKIMVSIVFQFKFVVSIYTWLPWVHPRWSLLLLIGHSKNLSPGDSFLAIFHPFIFSFCNCYGVCVAYDFHFFGSHSLILFYWRPLLSWNNNLSNFEFQVSVLSLPRLVSLSSRYNRYPYFHFIRVFIRSIR